MNAFAIAESVLPGAHQVSARRWSEAQRRELHFWKNWRTYDPYRNLNLHEYWDQELANFGCAASLFQGRRVLDVGCGPHGLIHFLESAAQRICVDPLLLDFEMPEKGLPALVAVGERLPLRSASIDVAVCFNALDHMQRPEAAMAEIARVLRPGGTVLFMIHTFPWWTRPLWWIDRLHPHHFTEQCFVLSIETWFVRRQTATTARRFDVPVRRWLLPSSWKYLAAQLVVGTTYVCATKALR
jgi:SAM-dependent methyltransferase